jgi:hypothetical protein
MPMRGLKRGARGVIERDFAFRGNKAANRLPNFHDHGPMPRLPDIGITRHRQFCVRSAAGDNTYFMNYFSNFGRIRQEINVDGKGAARATA